jgi:TonB family protein
MPATFRSSFAVLLFLLASASLAQSPPPAGPPYRVGGNVLRPEKISGAPPAFTKEARKAGVTGAVILETLIDEQGNVTDIKVLQGLPKGLDQAAVEAVKTWKFKPATLEGRPVAVYYTLTVSYTIDADAPGAASGAAPVSAHEEAAREVVKLFLGEDMAIAGTESMMAMFGQDPEAAPYRDVFREWYRKVLADSDLETEMARIYMDTFSEKELREIVAFYKTPVGRKVIATMPELMQKGAEIGMRQAEAHAAELQEILAKAREESEKRPAATAGAAQKRTIADIRNTGTAMFSWLTDQVGAGAAGQSQMEKEKPPVDLRQYDLISREELVKILVPTYIRTIPETDGWGHPYEYYLAVENPLGQQVMAIRSPGRDGKFSALDYTVGAFEPGDVDEDIVWVDGFFVRWPQPNQPDGK